jgi:tRNA A-37 threonylcarbamoyl transferase component Bud32
MDHHAEFEFMGCKWSVKPELTDFFKKKLIPLIFSDDDSSSLRVVRRKPTRDSFLISIDSASPEVFVKVHKHGKQRDKIKMFFGLSRAKAEWVMGRRMFECGLPVAEPLGLGECGSDGCVLVVEALPRCISLSKYLRQKQRDKSLFSSQEINEFLRSLGRLIRKVHTEGFRHPDLHADNILVDPDVSPPGLWLVDLHSVGSSPVISNRKRMADMARMVFFLRGLLEESQLREVLAGYEPDADESKIDIMFSRLLNVADSLRKRRIRSRAKRCLKTSGKFIVETVGDKKLYRRREFDTETILHAIDRHNDIRKQRGAELVKFTSTSVLTSFPLPKDHDEKIYVKEFENRGLIRLLETLFYVHRGKRAWKASHLLQILDVPCPEPIALVEAGKPGILRKSYLVMKEIPDAAPLNLFLLDKYFRVSGCLTHAEVLEKRNLIIEGAQALRAFHARKIYHKDLSAKNLLVNPAYNGKLRFYCVDANSLQFPPRLSLRRRIKNLAQLNGVPSCITMMDKVRFYKEYFEVPTLTRKHKIFIKVILLISRRRFIRSRQADQEIREKESSGTESYEDTASL